MDTKKKLIENLIPHNLPTIGQEEEDAVLRVLRSKQLSQGDEVELFENEFCDYLGLPHGSAKLPYPTELLHYLWR